MRRTIAQTFADLRQKKQIGLMPFVPAGYPDLATTAAVIAAMDRAGASVIEVGIPFSDPVADGPVIQAAFTEALAKKLKVTDVFQTIASIRPSVVTPLVAMVSYSVVFRYGLERFLTEAGLCGFDGVILPDLPPPEAQAVCQRVRQAKLDMILLIAPTTASDRRASVAELCSGFVYYLSVSGITGERQSLPEDLRRQLTELKAVTDKPVCVGFGISKPEHVAQLKGLADGAIVGTGVVRRMQSQLSAGPEVIAQSVEAYVRELLGKA